MDANKKSREELLDETIQLRHENSVLQTKLTNSQNYDFYKQLTEITSTLHIIYLEDRIVFANAAATELLGYSEEEFLQAKFMDFIHP
ncbi:MAG: PAS domain S-box protein, partial [Bacteroidales bacterium]|nr:PAS domain S-box protein [Bacteroidales bacterium]